jgi:hypothetical protein
MEICPEVGRMLMISGDYVGIVSASEKASDPNNTSCSRKKHAAILKAALKSIAPPRARGGSLKGGSSGISEHTHQTQY